MIVTIGYAIIFALCGQDIFSFTLFKYRLPINNKYITVFYTLNR